MELVAAKPMPKRAVPARAAAAMNRDERRMAVLLGVADLLQQAVDLDALLAALVDRIAIAMKADRGTIFLVDRARGDLFSKAAHLPELAEIRVKLGQGIAGTAAESGQVVNVPATHADRRFFRGIDERTGYQTRTALAAPMRDRDGVIIGVVEVLNRRDGVFGADDEELLEALAAQAAAALETTSLGGALRRVEEGSARPPPLAYRFNRIVGESPAMQRAYGLTEKAARTDATVLIRGESGCGKELIARAVHVNSGRREKPFVKVDCAALPESLIENELFGHEKGAFTGADRRSAGKFEAASGGTVFIDELGELPLAVQGKLLGVLQDREFTRVGGTAPVKVDVRVVAATNRDLEAMVKAGTFRADLYYRVRVVEIALPPLRERGEADIARLVHHFLDVFAKKHGLTVTGITEAAMRRLVQHAWPGNVRELENCIESAVVLSEGGLVRPEHLPLPGSTEAAGRPRPPSSESQVRSLAEVEKEAIADALRACKGNRTRAAEALGIGRNTLNRKIKEYGVG
jgi:Nif-specific regulatory protein